MIVVIILIFSALFAYFVIYAKNYAILLEPFTNIDGINKSIHVRRYLNSIHPNQYRNKISNINWNSINNNYIKKIQFKRMYLDSIQKIDDKYLSMLNQYINEAKILFKKCGLDNLNKYEWNMVKSIGNLEDKMPYTLDKYIVINQDMLNNSLDYYNTYGVDIGFLETLIHEQIHVIQRHNQNKFNGFYRKHYSFLHTKISINKLPDKVKQKYMTNPDSNFDIWIYKIFNSLYYPILEKKGDSYHDVGYGIITNKPVELYKLKKSLGYKSSVSFYHPNEIFACYVAHRIINNNLIGKYHDFLRLF